MAHKTSRFWKNVYKKVSLMLRKYMLERIPISNKCRHVKVRLEMNRVLLRKGLNKLRLYHTFHFIGLTLLDGDLLKTFFAVFLWKNEGPVLFDFFCKNFVRGKVWKLDVGNKRSFLLTLKFCGQKNIWSKFHQKRGQSGH